MTSVDLLPWAIPAALSASHGERDQAQGATQAYSLTAAYPANLSQEQGTRGR